MVAIMGKTRLAGDAGERMRCLSVEPMLGRLWTDEPSLHTYSFCCGASQKHVARFGECNFAHAAMASGRLRNCRKNAFIAAFSADRADSGMDGQTNRGDDCCTAIAVIHEYVCTITALARAAVKLPARPGNVVIRRVVATRAAIAWTCE
jgi:hypothetical protein